MATLIVFVAVLIVAAVVLWAVTPKKKQGPEIKTALRDDGREVHFEEPKNGEPYG